MEGEREGARAVGSFGEGLSVSRLGISKWKLNLKAAMIVPRPAGDWRGAFNLPEASV